MKNIIIFSSNFEIVSEWKSKKEFGKLEVAYDFDSLESSLSQLGVDTLLLVDYDSVSSEFNKLIVSDRVPQKVVILERVPEVLTGKMLLSHGVKAYGNTSMLAMHFEAMLATVEQGKVWTYPELTAALVKREESLSAQAEELLEHRLTEQEKNVVMAILEGLTNDAIAHKLGVTTRTVKAHISAIFAKLHVNDRVSLILLLK